ncbi:MAG: hypothetical protein L6R42_011509 [Xanthoria sp. 1 TBL-2021]|nr:MAG: hypothetical protein L6R42_011509 [Xanthoria sp. 1 TBL-2021]
MHYKTALLTALAVATFTVAAPVNVGGVYRLFTLNKAPLMDSETTEAKVPAAVNPLIDFFYIGYDKHAETESDLEDREIKITAKDRD